MRKPKEKRKKANSPIKSEFEPKENELGNSPMLETKKGKKTQGKGRWKQVARAKSKAQELIISAQLPLVGMKRGIELEESEDQHKKPNKRVCGMLSCVGGQLSDLLAVAAT